jgi:hypothetical protein
VSEVKLKKGFACMSEERRRQISSMGGKAWPADKPRGFAANPQLAKEAALKAAQLRRAKTIVEIPKGVES